MRLATQRPGTKPAGCTHGPARAKNARWPGATRATPPTDGGHRSAPTVHQSWTPQPVRPGMRHPGGSDGVRRSRVAQIQVVRVDQTARSAPRVAPVARHHAMDASRQARLADRVHTGAWGGLCRRDGRHPMTVCRDRTSPVEGEDATRRVRAGLRAQESVRCLTHGPARCRPMTVAPGEPEGPPVMDRPAGSPGSEPSGQIGRLGVLPERPPRHTTVAGRTTARSHPSPSESPGRRVLHHPL